MSESYISKVALSEAVLLSLHNNPHKDGKIRINHNNEHHHFLHMIYHAPEADVRPVVHARWEDCSNGWMCSACTRDSTHDTPYCPNCGATMDLERQGTDE